MCKVYSPSSRFLIPLGIEKCIVKFRAGLKWIYNSACSISGYLHVGKYTSFLCQLNSKLYFKPFTTNIYLRTI